MKCFRKFQSCLKTQRPQESLRIKSALVALVSFAASVMADGSSETDGADAPNLETLAPFSDTPAVTGEKTGIEPSSVFPGFSADDRSVNLLRAIKPYMRESRAGKIDSAIRIMQMLKVIGQLK